MIKYIIKRLLAGVLTIIVLITISFFMMHAMPGSPFSPNEQKNVPPGFKPALEDQGQAAGQEEELSTTAFWQAHRREILVGLALVMLIAAGGAMLLRSFLLDRAVPARTAGMSCIRPCVCRVLSPGQTARIPS